MNISNSSSPQWSLEQRGFRGIIYRRWFAALISETYKYFHIVSRAHFVVRRRVDSERDVPVGLSELLLHSGPLCCSGLLVVLCFMTVKHLKLGPQTLTYVQIQVTLFCVYACILNNTTRPLYSYFTCAPIGGMNYSSCSCLKCWKMLNDTIKLTKTHAECVMK